MYITPPLSRYRNAIYITPSKIRHHHHAITVTPSLSRLFQRDISVMHFHHNLSVTPFSQRHVHHFISVMISECHCHHAIYITPSIHFEISVSPSLSRHFPHAICITSSLFCHIYRAFSVTASSRHFRHLKYAISTAHLTSTIYIHFRFPFSSPTFNDNQVLSKVSEAQNAEI